MKFDLAIPCRVEGVIAGRVTTEVRHVHVACDIPEASTLDAVQAFDVPVTPEMPYRFWHGAYLDVGDTADFDGRPWMAVGYDKDDLGGKSPEAVVKALLMDVIGTIEGVAVYHQDGPAADEPPFTDIVTDRREAILKKATAIVASTMLIGDKLYIGDVAPLYALERTGAVSVIPSLSIGKPAYGVPGDATQVFGFSDRTGLLGALGAMDAAPDTPVEIGKLTDTEFLPELDAALLRRDALRMLQAADLSGNPQARSTAERWMMRTGGRDLRPALEDLRKALRDADATPAGLAEAALAFARGLDLVTSDFPGDRLKDTLASVIRVSYRITGDEQTRTASPGRSM